jgi:DNA helicase TIP49 (TBP-interacting protein)
VAELCLTSVVASELFSLDLSKTEVLTREAADISGRRPVGGWRWQEAGAVVSGVVPL